MTESELTMRPCGRTHCTRVTLDEHKLCFTCRANKRLNRNVRRVYKKCVGCGVPIAEHWHCQRCRDMRNDDQKQRRDERRKAGLCVHCGATRGKFTSCDDCAKKRRAREALRRGRKR